MQHQQSQEGDRSDLMLKVSVTVKQRVLGGLVYQHIVNSPMDHPSLAEPAAKPRIMAKPSRHDGRPNPGMTPAG